MKLILITHPEPYPNEMECLIRLFEAGLTRLHLRKPTDSDHRLADMIRQIPMQYHKHVVLHQHYHLAEEFQLGGLHVTGKTTQAEKDNFPTHLPISRSCHSLEEVEAHWEKYSYLFLSPIFPAISKPGYRSAFTPEELEEFFSNHPAINNCIALGGITSERIRVVKAMGFGGVALLGDIWQPGKSPREVVNSFMEIGTLINQISKQN